MTVLSKFSRLTDPELSYWSKLPQDVLEMVLKQPQLVARENFDACMREFKYGRRRRQYETFQELHDPESHHYIYGCLFFGASKHADELLLACVGEARAGTPRGRCIRVAVPLHVGA